MMRSPPLYRAERKELALWASLARSQPARQVERGPGGEFVEIREGEGY